MSARILANRDPEMLTQLQSEDEILALTKKMFAFYEKRAIVISINKTSRVEMYALSAWRTGSCLWDESRQIGSWAWDAAVVCISHPAAYPY